MESLLDLDEKSATITAFWIRPLTLNDSLILLAESQGKKVAKKLTKQLPNTTVIAKAPFFTGDHGSERHPEIFQIWQLHSIAVNFPLYFDDATLEYSELKRKIENWYLPQITAQVLQRRQDGNRSTLFKQCCGFKERESSSST